MSSGKILVAQGGGPTAVINQSMVGVTLEARRFRNVTRIYGALHGVRGIVNEDFLDLTQETSHNLELVAATPSSALGSTRDKPDMAYCQRIFDVLRAHEHELLRSPYRQHETHLQCQRRTHAPTGRGGIHRPCDSVCCAGCE